jgi:SNF2 family DNA or RNA helicase
MLNKLATQIKNKEITAANEGVKMSKLLQISAGFAYDANGVGRYCGGTERFKEIFEIIEAASGKVIVLSPFRYFVELFGKVAGQLSLGNPKMSVAIVHGDVAKTARDVIYSDFQKSAVPRILCAHPKTMAHGLTLTAADTVIWASPPTSLELYEQANARITRAGQTQNTLIVNISGTKMEEKVFARLKRNAALQGTLLEMFEDTTQEL